MEERNYKLYVHISPSNKRYYGITGKKRVQDRWHYGNGYPNNQHFTNAINKYGWHNFEHIVLFDNLTKEEACLLEQMYIALYNTANPKYGYNNNLGGDHALHSEQTKKKLSKINKGKNNPNYGKHHTEEAKKKISEANKGKHLAEKTKKKISEANKGENSYWEGKHLTEEHKRKMSMSMKGKNKGKNNGFAKAVLMFTLDGTFIGRFDCIGDANEYLGKKRHSGQICECAKGKSKTAYGYIWIYEEDYIKEQKEAI